METEAVLATPPPGALDLADYDYVLPPELVAQTPQSEREAARMLVLDRTTGQHRHASVSELPSSLAPGDLLVLNATRVLPAKLRGRKETGGRAEALLLGPVPDRPGVLRALVGCRGRLREGQRFVFSRAEKERVAELVSLGDDGEVLLRFAADESPYDVGETPLPPYIRRDAPDPADALRYQSLFARVPGSVAAPTASLHLGERLLTALDARGVSRSEVVLHVGPGTFRPVGPEQIASGRLHAEPIELPEETANAIARARDRGGRVVAVGTTVARVLESCARDDGRVEAAVGKTSLFLRPGDRFRVVDALLTNFHLPRSSLLLLVAAFAGRASVLAAYAEAVRARYRFFSYGDCMLLR